MHNPLRLLDSPDVIPLLAVMGILYFLGQYLVNAHPTCRESGNHLGVAAFFAYCAYAYVTFGAIEAADWLWIAVRGLLAAGFLRVLAWIVLPILAFGFRRFITKPAESARTRRAQKAQQREAARHARRREEEQRRALEEYARNAPQRERTGQMATAAQRRREDVRISCEVLYQRFKLELAERFPSADFDSFRHKYLGDDRSAEEVEQRAEQLKDLIQQHLDQLRVKPKRDFNSMAELNAWYGEQLAQAEAIPDERLRAVMIAKLKARFADFSLRTCEEHDR